jgi:hypothetical protein
MHGTMPERIEIVAPIFGKANLPNWAIVWNSGYDSGKQKTALVTQKSLPVAR